MTDSKIIIEKFIAKNWYVYVRQEGDKYIMFEATYWSTDDILEFNNPEQAREAAISYADALYERNC